MDVVGVIVGRGADAGCDMTGQRPLGDDLGAVPGPGDRSLRQRTVAGEAELATGGALRTLEDHAADAVGVVGVAHAVQDNLGDGLLAFGGFKRGLVIDALGQAAQGATAIFGRGGLEDERRGDAQKL